MEMRLHSSYWLGCDGCGELGSAVRGVGALVSFRKCSRTHTYTEATIDDSIQ